MNDINEYHKKNVLSEGNKEELIRLQSKLDELYLNKARGACIRSRAKWIEDGKKHSFYFNEKCNHHSKF